MAHYNDNDRAHNPGTQPYSDRHDEYDPYAPEHQGAYNGAYPGYRDDAFVPPDHDNAVEVTPGMEKRDPYGHERVPSFGGVAPPKSTSALRLWRHDEHGNLWTKGSRGRCFGRFFCCSLMTFLVLLLGVVATLALWIRPPNISFNGVVIPTSNQVTATTDGFKINVNLNISVDNPNFFSATFKEISAVGSYPTNSSSNIGGGELTNIKFGSHSNTVLLFPFEIDYTQKNDPNLTIITDIASKCGIGGTKSNIVVNYVLTLKINIIATISPSFKSSASFPCPLTEDQIKSIAGGLLSGSS